MGLGDKQLAESSPPPRVELGYVPQAPEHSVITSND